MPRARSRSASRSIWVVFPAPSMPSKVTKQPGATAPAPAPLPARRSGALTAARAPARLRRPAAWRAPLPPPRAAGLRRGGLLLAAPRGRRGAASPPRPVAGSTLTRTCTRHRSSRPLAGPAVGADEVLDHLARLVVGELHRRRLLEVGRGRDQRALEPVVQRQLAAAHGVDDHAGRVGRVPHLELHLEVERHVAEGRALHADVAPLAVRAATARSRWARRGRSSSASS